MAGIGLRWMTSFVFYIDPLLGFCSQCSLLIYLFMTFYKPFGSQRLKTSLYKERTFDILTEVRQSFLFLTYSLPLLLTFDHVLGSCCSERLNLPCLSQSRQERVIYLKRKPYYPLFERSFEIGRIFAMEGSKRVLVEAAPFLSTSTKTNLEPSMAKIRPVSKLLSNNG